MPNMLRCRAVLFAVAALGSLAGAEEEGMLSTDDECTAVGQTEHPHCALNALQHRKVKAEVTSNKTASTASTTLTVYHWSPHWQCFWNHSSCAGHAIGSLNANLEQLKPDFANVIELIDEGYHPPGDYKMTRSYCNDKETASLIYDASRWSPGLARRGCMRFQDRAFVVQVFQNKDKAAALNRVMVVAAHYPHSSRVPALRSAIGGLISSSGEHRILYMADTNLEVPSQEIASYLNLPSASNILASPLFITCCNIWKGYVFPYDRIITNFGDSMKATLHHQHLPSWAGPAMHKAVHAIITATAGDDGAVSVHSVNSSQGSPPEKLQGSSTEVGPPEEA